MSDNYGGILRALQTHNSAVIGMNKVVVVVTASRNLLTEFDSSKDKNEEPPRKAKRTELANIWSDDEEQEGRPLDATPSKSSKKKENNKGKGKGKNKKAKKNNK